MIEKIIIYRKDYKEKSILKIIFNKFVLLAAMLPMVSTLRILLYSFVGMKIGKHVFIASYVLFDDQYPEFISIGDNVTISYRTTVLTHDDSSGIIAPVKIEDNAWIGACVTILPGIVIGGGSVIGAGTTISKDVPANTKIVSAEVRIISTKKVEKSLLLY